MGQAPLSPPEVAELRKRRRFPRPTQFDYLHLRYLRDSLSAAIAEAPGPVRDVLDIYCGARPYDDLLPAGASCIGLDIDHTYGVADVVSEEFLPFPDESFDLVMCIEGFHFVRDLAHGIAEIERVLRPGGTVLITHTLPWEYIRHFPEHRFTGPGLAALFEGWQDAKVVESGGRAVAWATQTGRIVNLTEERLLRRDGIGAFLRLPFAALYLVINAVGALLDLVDRRYGERNTLLPMSVVLTAQRPA